MINPGTIVRYRPEWCTEDERYLLHIVKESRLNPVTNEMTRCLIVTLNSNLAFQPSETVEEEMIEPVYDMTEELARALSTR